MTAMSWTHYNNIITEVGKSQPSSGDRKVEAIINQLITGQVGLNYLT